MQTQEPSRFLKISRMVSRRRQGRVIVGVAGGIADRLGVTDLYVRAGFLVLTLIWGVGLALYLVLWALTLDRTDHPAPSPPAGGERKAGYVLMFAGGILLLRTIGIWSGDRWFWPGAAVIFGVAFLMDRRDIDPRTAILALFDPSSGGFRSRTVIGILLLVIGLSILGAAAVPAVATVLVAIMVTGVGMAVLFGPWVWRLVTDLGAERRRRIREEERADMAAHLHDSVLQTLALIQRTDDPRRVVTLARVQERELRRWLYESTPTDGPELLSDALQKEADRIAAAGEALTNAARHSGADRISVYSEVGEEAADVWVSDLGAGFDSLGVASDRRGIAESIIARMANHDGAARVSSEPGEGTEVHLRLKTESS